MAAAAKVEGRIILSASLISHSSFLPTRQNVPAPCKPVHPPPLGYRAFSDPLSPPLHAPRRGQFFSHFFLRPPKKQLVAVGFLVFPDLILFLQPFPRRSAPWFRKAFPYLCLIEIHLENFSRVEYPSTFILFSATNGTRPQL